MIWAFLYIIGVMATAFLVGRYGARFELEDGDCVIIAVFWPIAWLLAVAFGAIVGSAWCVIKFVSWFIKKGRRGAQK